MKYININNMKTYRLKKWYPSLQRYLKDREVIAVEVREHNIYDLKINDDVIQPLLRDEVENNPEYWEEVKPKEYEILSIKCKISGFILGEDNFGKPSFCGKNDTIFSVKRLSDGEVFRVGDLCSPKSDPENKQKITEIYEAEKGYLRISSDNYYLGINDIQHCKDCTCTYPKLQKETRECGNCGNFIDREKHIILTERCRLIDEFYKKIALYDTVSSSKKEIKHLINLWENFKNEQ